MKHISTFFVFRSVNFIISYFLPQIGNNHADSPTKSPRIWTFYRSKVEIGTNSSLHPAWLCMRLEKGIMTRHHDNAGGSRKKSAVAADHIMQVKEMHYEKVGEDIEQLTESYQKYHPGWVEGW